MHYFPSTYSEMQDATARIRCEATMTKQPLPRLIIWGRLQDLEFRNSFSFLHCDWQATKLYAQGGPDGEFMGIPFKVDYSRPYCFEPVT